MTQQPYDVLYIGNYTKDKIITPTETKYVDGGAVNYAAHAAAKLGSRVAVVTRLAEEDSHVVESFRNAGIDCYPTFSPSSTLMTLDYPTANPDLRYLSVAGVADAITAADIKDLSASSAVIGSSLRGEVGLDVIQSLHEKKITVAADMQGFVRVLRGKELKYEPWPEMEQTLAYVDILKSDMVEAEHLTGQTDILKAAQFYANLGPKEIVLTHANGVLIYTAHEQHEFLFHAATLIGRSGRGDTCVGSYTALRLSKPPRESGLWAAAVTSMKMERLGPFNRTIPEVEDFIATHYDHASA